MSAPILANIPNIKVLKLQFSSLKMKNTLCIILQDFLLAVPGSQFQKLHENSEIGSFEKISTKQNGLSKFLIFKARNEMFEGIFDEYKS